MVSQVENYLTALDDAFRALADPTRRAVITRLSRGSASITELAEPFALGLPTFLKHIKMLERSGLVESVKVGRVRTCTLRQDKFAELDQWLNEQRALWQSRYENLDKLAIALARDSNET